MLDGIRDSVIRLAQEEEMRRQGQFSKSDGAGGGSNSGKKKKKKKFQQMVVNAERVVLFDFQAAPDYPEQVSVKANEVVFVFESFEDGWSQVKNYSGSQGVVPTAYLGNILQLDKTTPNSKSFFSPQFKQRSKVLGLMAVDKFKAKASALAEWAFNATKFAVTDMIIPTGVKLFLIVSRNESYTTIISGFVRRFYESVCASLVHTLSDEELAVFSAKLRDDSTRVKAEKARRAGAPPPPPRQASLTTESAPSEGGS